MNRGSEELQVKLSSVVPARVLSGERETKSPDADHRRDWAHSSITNPDWKVGCQDTSSPCVDVSAEDTAPSLEDLSSIPGAPNNHDVRFELTARSPNLMREGEAESWARGEE